MVSLGIGKQGAFRVGIIFLVFLSDNLFDILTGCTICSVVRNQIFNNENKYYG